MLSRCLASVALIFAAGNFVLAQEETALPELKLETLEQKASYIIGMSIGKQIGGNIPVKDAKLQPELIAQGFLEALQGAAPRMTEEEMRAIMTSLDERMVEIQQQAAEANKVKGQEFLAANAKKEGVKVTESGLQYKIVQAGNGASPAATDTVKTNYKGTLIDGTVFDSSYDRGQPATFGVNQVIRGWTEALQLMKVGSKWTIYVPSELAYGPQGAGGDIGPNETLIFEIELLEIVQ